MSDENDNDRAGPSPSAVAGADAVRMYVERKAAEQAQLVDLLHKALACRFGEPAKTKEGE